MGQPKPPQSNPKRDLAQATKAYIKYLPQLLELEQTARGRYNPTTGKVEGGYDTQRIEEQLGLQRQYGPEMYAQQRKALSTIDPESWNLRSQLAGTVGDTLAAARRGQLPPGLMDAWTAQARGAEVARGNVSGAAPTAFEDIFKGQNLLNYQQQAQQNVGAFLAGATPEQQLLAVQHVTPDRASAYVNPSAPAQYAQNSYQNMLAQWQASGAGQTPGWVGLSGQVVGGVLGGYFGGGPQGAQLGSAAGNVAATSSYNLFSDARKKNHIEYVGRSPKGHPIYEFCYDDVPDQRFRGTVAQELLATCPEACTLGEDGFWRVDYGKTDIKLEQIPAEVYA